MSRPVDVRRPRAPRALVTLLGPALLALSVAAPASAQREFIEEVEQDPLDGVDLDAPDPAEASPKARPDAGPARAPDAAGPRAPDPRAPDPRGKLPRDPPKAEAAAPKAAPPEAGDPLAEPAGVRVLETSLPAFLEKWDVRAAAVRKGEVARANKLLTDVDEGLLDLGVQGVPGGLQAPATATALLLEGRLALDEGSAEDAVALVDTAERAAPDLVAVHTQRAHVSWARGDVGATLGALVQAVQAHARDPLAASQVLARLLAVLLAVVVVLAALFAALAGIPALRLLSFDLLQVLPKGAHGGQVLALVVMAALAPLVVGAGPVFGALWILSLSWLYVTARERVVIAVVAALCLALPFGVAAVAGLAAYPGSRADRAHRALFDAHAEAERLAIAARLPAPPAALAAAPDGAPADAALARAALADLGDLDVFEVAALAYWHKREGRLDQAKALLEALTARWPDAAWANGELGVVAALKGNESQALVELGKAGAGEGVSAASAHAAAFDASLIHFRGGRTDKAETAVSSVAKEAPALLNGFRRTTFRAPDQVVTHNRAFVDAYPAPLAPLRAQLAASTDEAQATADAIARPLLRGQLGTRAAALLAAFLVVWAGLFAARKKLAPAQACARCGSPASRRVDGKDVPAETCSQCFHAFVSTRSRIDAGVKLRKEREIIQRRARLGRVILGLGVVFPGAGHIYGGAPVRGAVFATLHTLGVSALVLASGWLPMPRLAGPWSSLVPLVLTGAAVVVVWLFSLRSAWALSEDASGRGRR